jgi:CDP-glucose 4,6-dehydratase
MIDKNFWKDKKVLVTGHSGFKGFWMLLLLKKLGSNVYGVSIDNNSSEIYKTFSKYEKLVNEEFIDIRDGGKLTKYLEEIKPDIVFHLAAQSLVHTAKHNPKDTLEINILGSFNLLNVITKSNKRTGVVVATTDKVYEHPEQINTEENALGSFEFYGASKVGLENVIDAFNNDMETRNKISRVRSGNVLGGGDGGDNRLLTDIITSIKSNKNIHLRNPDSIRPWQFVLDSVGGYLLVAQENFKNNIPEKYNLNSEKADDITVFELTKKLVKRFESSVEIIIDRNIKYTEAKELRLSSKKAIKKLNWKNFYKPEEIIENIFLWENVKSEPSVIEATNNQVIEYIEKASS